MHNRARFDLRLEYTEPTIPPLADENAGWTQGLVATWQPPV